MAGKRALLLADEPFEADGYPRVVACEDGLSMMVGDQLVVLAEHMPDGSRYGQWYPLPAGQGLQMRILPSQYLQLQTPDCDEPDAPVGPKTVFVAVEDVQDETGPERLFHVHGVGQTRPYDPKQDDECFAGDLSYGFIGHGSEGQSVSIVAFSTVGLAATLIATIEMNAQLNGVYAQLSSQLDQARLLVRESLVKAGLREQCGAINDLDGRRCKLAVGHPSAGPVLSALTDGAITMAGHVWEEAGNGGDQRPAPSAG